MTPSGVQRNYCKRRDMLKKTPRPALSKKKLDALVSEAIVDAYGEYL